MSYKIGSPYILCEKTIDKKQFYYMSFKDGPNKGQAVEITETLYLQFKRFDMDDESEGRSDRRHYEHSELTEESLYNREIQFQQDTEEAVYAKIQGEKLQQAIAELPEIQHRRFLFYYEYGLTYEKIAEMEGCTKMPIKRSIDRALDKIKEINQAIAVDFDMMNC